MTNEQIIEIITKITNKYLPSNGKYDVKFETNGTDENGIAYLETFYNMNINYEGQLVFQLNEIKDAIKDLRNGKDHYEVVKIALHECRHAQQHSYILSRISKNKLLEINLATEDYETYAETDADLYSIAKSSFIVDNFNIPYNSKKGLHKTYSYLVTLYKYVKYGLIHSFRIPIIKY